MINFLRLTCLLRPLILVIFLCMITLAQATALTGEVRDSADAPVAGASLSVLSGRQSVLATVTADAQGRFTLADLPAGTYELLIAARGFASRRHALQVPLTEPLALRLGIAALTAEVTVTADVGTVQELDKTTQQVNVIDERELQQRATSVLAQGFSEEAGLQLQRTSATMSAVFVRGFTGAKVVTFVDGVRFSNAAARGGVNSFFNLNDASSLRAAEVLRGPNSAQFGSDSLGGSVQLLSQTPVFSADERRIWQGQISTHYNSADHSFGSNARVTTGTQRLALLLSVNGHRSNTLRSGGGIDTHAAVTRFLGLPSTVLGARSTDTAFTQYGGLAKANFKATAHDLFALHYHRAQIDGGKRFDQTLGGDGNLLADLRNFISDFFYARYERSGAGAFASLTTSYSFNVQREERRNQGGNGNSAGTITFQPERTSVHGLQIQANREDHHNRLVVGADAYFDFVISPSFTVNPVTNVANVARGRVPDGARYRQVGIYIQDVMTLLAERLRVIGALRVGRASYRSRAADSPLINGRPLWPDDKLGVTAVTPRLGAVWTLAEGFNFSAQVARGFRAPHITDLATLGLTGNGFEASAPDLAGRGATIGSTADRNALSTGRPVTQLVPETMWGYEAGLHLHRARIDIDLNGFVNQLKNNIAVQTLILPAGAVGQTLGDQIIMQQLPSGAVFVAASTNPVLIRANFDDARIWGIEQKFDLRLTNAWTLSQNFTYLHAADARTGHPPNIEGGTPAPQGNLRIRYQPQALRFWVEPYFYGARRQTRLSTLDLEDRRTGATRSRASIANFFARGAAVRGLIAAGTDGRLGTADDRLIPTGETLAQVQTRVLGAAESAPLFPYIPGFFVASVRGGVRLSDTTELTLTLENLLDKNYRGISWGMDAPGRSFGLRLVRRF